MAAAGFLAAHLRGGLRHQAADGLILGGNVDRTRFGGGVGCGSGGRGLWGDIARELRFGIGQRAAEFCLQSSKFGLQRGLGLIRKDAGRGGLDRRFSRDFSV